MTVGTCWIFCVSIGHTENEKCVVGCVLRFQTLVARAMVSSYVNCVFMQKKIENYVEDMQ